MVIENKDKKWHNNIWKSNDGKKKKKKVPRYFRSMFDEGWEFGNCRDNKSVLDKKITIQMCIVWKHFS